MFYHHDLEPFLWRWRDSELIGLRWYSLAYIVGFLLVYGVLYRAVRRRRIPNADFDRLEEACLYLIASVIIGGRLGYYILNQPQELLTARGWIELPQLWKGGMAFFGAALALFVTEYYFCRANRAGFWHGADRITWAFAFALAFGRIANFINGELVGIPTNGNWGVYFPAKPELLVNGVNVPRHPEQLYAALSHFLLGLYMIYLLRRKPRSEFDRMPGFALFHFLVGYGLLRFVTDFWRQESVYFGPINGGQVLSLLLVVIAWIGARRRFRWLKEHGTELDWYPPEGIDGELPEGCFAYINEVTAKRAAEEAARQERRARRRRR